MSSSAKRSLSFIIGSLLVLDSLWLLALDKIHLGIIFPLIIGIGLMLYALFFNRIQNFIQLTSLRQTLWRYAWAGFFLWISTLVIFFSYVSIIINIKLHIKN